VRESSGLVRIPKKIKAVSGTHSRQNTERRRADCERVCSERVSSKTTRDQRVQVQLETFERSSQPCPPSSCPFSLARFCPDSSLCGSQLVSAPHTTPIPIWSLSFGVLIHPSHSLQRVSSPPSFRILYPHLSLPLRSPEGKCPFLTCFLSVS